MPGCCWAFLFLATSDQIRCAVGSELEFPRKSLLMVFLLSEAAVDLGKQGIFVGLPANTQIGAVRLRKSSSLQSFADAPLVVINNGKIAEAGHVINEELRCLAPSFNATIEF
jgi:hypothetical protein